jgi:serine/threonine protein kinase
MEQRREQIEELARVIGECSEDEVRTLIAQLKSGTIRVERSLGEQPTADLPGAGQASRPSTVGEPEDREGAVIGRYKLLERLGEGGFGVVYAAEQSEPVRRRVALKLLKRGMDTEKVVARFEAERQALALMDHPGIAKVLDAGATESGRPYFVMELVRGQPITEFCDAARLGVRERVGLLRTVCAAVQHAHQKGVIHRDLKPSNVLVTLQDGEPAPKVIDFGIAKAVRGRLADEAVYTHIHQMMGTPGYMSPEQTGGSSFDIDTRTDIYSLGVIAYVLLAGALPFDEERLNGATPSDLQRMITEEAPRRPSARFAALGERREAVARARSSEPRRVERAIRGDLDWIVLKCLEKDRARRYESISALDDDLGRHLADEPVKAGPPSALYLTSKFVSRNRAQVASAVAAALLLVAALGATTVAWSRARDQSQQLRFTLDFFGRVLAGETDGPGELALWQERPDLTLGHALRDAERHIASTFEGQPELEAVVRELIGLAQLRAAEYDGASQQLARAADLRSGLRGESDAATLRLLLPLAEAQSKMGDYEGAIRTADRALTLSTEALGPEHSATRSAALWLARWHAAAYRFEEAERHFELASRTVGGLTDSRDPLTVAATIERCAVLISKGRADRAEEILRSLAPRLDNLPAGGETVRSRLNRQLGMALVVRGRPDEAIGLIGGGGSIGPPLAPEVDRFQARMLAWALCEAGRAEEAEGLFRALLEAERTSPGPPFREIFAQIYYADALLRMGRPGEALAQILPALERYDALGLPNDPDRLWAKSILGLAHLGSGDAEAAARAIEEAVETESLFPEHRLYLPAIRFAHALLLRARGDAARAGAEFERSLALGREVYGSASPAIERMRAVWASGD